MGLIGIIKETYRLCKEFESNLSALKVTLPTKEEQIKRYDDIQELNTTLKQMSHNGKESCKAGKRIDWLCGFDIDYIINKNKIRFGILEGEIMHGFSKKTIQEDSFYVNMSKGESCFIYIYYLDGKIAWSSLEEVGKTYQAKPLYKIHIINAKNKVMVKSVVDQRGMIY